MGEARTAELPVQVREMLATHEALRRLGFAPDDIFACWNAGGYVGIALRAQGLEFVVSCGRFISPAPTGEEFASLWEAAGEKVRDGSYRIDDLAAMYASSWVYRHREHLAAALLDKGFRFPVVERRRATAEKS